MIPFVKAHACGNDFLIVHEKYAGLHRAERARYLCDRHTGIGADGVEWVEETGGGVRAILSNADGSIAEISGNGTRCIAAWWAAKEKVSDVKVETAAGVKLCHILKHEGKIFQVETTMGTPQVDNFTLRNHAGVRVSIGNPHFVLFVDRFPDDWEKTGAQLAVDPTFPEGTNVEFVQIVDTNAIEFRIYERGAGPTQSSGTGSCASAVAAMATRDMPHDLRVIAPGGEQRVRWDDDILYLTGTAEIIASGEALL
jgi:diaminopimelate epimerase